MTDTKNKLNITILEQDEIEQAMDAGYKERKAEKQRKAKEAEARRAEREKARKELEAQAAAEKAAAAKQPMGTTQVSNSQIRSAMEAKEAFDKFAELYRADNPEQIYNYLATVFLSQPKNKDCWDEVKDNIGGLIALSVGSAFLFNTLPVLRWISTVPLNAIDYARGLVDARYANLRRFKAFLDSLDPTKATIARGNKLQLSKLITGPMRREALVIGRQGGSWFGKKGFRAGGKLVAYAMSAFILYHMFSKAGEKPGFEEPSKTIDDIARERGVAPEELGVLDLISGANIFTETTDALSNWLNAGKLFVVETTTQGVNEECKDILQIIFIILGAFLGAGVVKLGQSWRSFRPPNVKNYLGSITGQLSQSYQDAFQALMNGPLSALNAGQRAQMDELHQAFILGDDVAVFNWLEKQTGPNGAWPMDFKGAKDAFDKWKQAIYGGHKNVINSNEAIVINAAKNSTLAADALADVTKRIEEDLLTIEQLAARNLEDKGKGFAILRDKDLEKLNNAIESLGNNYVKYANAVDNITLSKNPFVSVKLGDDASKVLLTQYSGIHSRIDEVVKGAYKSAGLDNLAAVTNQNAVSKALEALTAVSRDKSLLPTFKQVKLGPGQTVLNQVDAVAQIKEQAKNIILNQWTEFIVAKNVDLGLQTASGAAFAQRVDDLKKLSKQSQDFAVDVLETVVKDPKKVTTKELLTSSALVRSVLLRNNDPILTTLGLARAKTVAVGTIALVMANRSPNTAFQQYLNQNGDGKEIFNDPDRARRFFNTLLIAFAGGSGKMGDPGATQEDVKNDNINVKRKKIFGVLKVAVFRQEALEINQDGTTTPTGYPYNKFIDEMINVPKGQGFNAKKTGEEFYEKYLKVAGISPASEETSGLIRGYLLQTDTSSEEIDAASERVINHRMLEFFVRNSNLKKRFIRYFKDFHGNLRDEATARKIIKKKLLNVSKGDVDNIELMIIKISKIRYVDDMVRNLDVKEVKNMNKSDLRRLVSEMLNENSGQGYAKYPYETNYHSDEEPDADYQVEWNSLVDEVCGPKKKNVDGDPNTYEDAAVEVAKILVKELDLFREVLELSGTNKSVGTEIMSQLKKAKEKKLVDKELKV